MNQNTTMRQTTSRPWAAFTLIELLVVIAIVAILAALLLPGLARAKEKGKQTFCINSERQQAMAVFMYADEHSDNLPPVAFRAISGYVTNWPELLYPHRKSARTHCRPTNQPATTNAYCLND